MVIISGYHKPIRNEWLSHHNGFIVGCQRILVDISCLVAGACKIWKLSLTCHIHCRTCKLRWLSYYKSVFVGMFTYPLAGRFALTHHSTPIYRHHRISATQKPRLWSIVVEKLIHDSHQNNPVVDNSWTDLHPTGWQPNNGMLALCSSYHERVGKHR